MPGVWVVGVYRLSNNVTRVKNFSSRLQHALKEERHFALMDGVAFSNRRLARNRFHARTQSDPCISSVATAIMITTSNSVSTPPAFAASISATYRRNAQARG